MAKGHHAVLLLGSNIPVRLSYLREAKILIEKEIGVVAKQSFIYESEPWGFIAEVSFLNQVLLVETNLPALALLKIIQKIEQQLGRKKKSGDVYSSRTIDIDILFYDGEKIDEPQLIVPHPHIHERRFTLVPLAEIVPQWVHPVFNKTCKQLLDECPDTGKVWISDKEKINDKV